jgi:hypothetical protein
MNCLVLNTKKRQFKTVPGFLRNSISCIFIKIIVNSTVIRSPSSCSFPESSQHQAWGRAFGQFTCRDFITYLCPACFRPKRHLGFQFFNLNFKFVSFFFQIFKGFFFKVDFLHFVLTLLSWGSFPSHADLDVGSKPQTANERLAPWRSWQ